ncbi:PQQ-binding-like beta-propeller repeat protein [Halorubrum sp. LN27]|uniref:outer membrane protein assembly factor BamB family protein n=1 Tax=Halorubrum sp. LN27 TaxID=2801032 RepID=UPI00190C2418|nr:PQQ-binding-like beta-propeller repeat protein [Halorubrum sp. LN27]
MNRRTALSALAVGGFAGLPGCLGDGSPDGTDAEPDANGSDPEGDPEAEAKNDESETEGDGSEPDSHELNREVDVDGVEDGSRSQFQWGPTHVARRDEAGPTDDVEVFWRQTGVWGEHSQPVVSGDQAYVSFDGTLLRLDLATGEVEWSTDLGHAASSSPAVRDGTAYLTVWNGMPGVDRGLAAVDIESGEVAWRRLTDADVTTSPVATDDGVFVGGGPDNGTVAAFDHDGTERWRHELADYASTPAIADGTVVYGAGDPRVVAYDAASGEELWARRVVGDATAPPTVADGRVLIGTRAGKLWALDIEDGAVDWTADLPGPVRRSVAVADDRAVVPTEDGLAAVGDDGDRLWTVGWIEYATAPVIGGDFAYLGHDRAVRAIALDDGTEQRSYPTRRREDGDVFHEGFEAPPTLVGDVLLAATEAGDVYAFGEA